MLILSRRVSESLVIVPQPHVDLATPVGDFFVSGPIEISVCQFHGGRVRFGVAADPRLLVLRAELYRPGKGW
jgi:sRNA-binding carbon storage regulator CsrA